PRHGRALELFHCLGYPALGRLEGVGWRAAQFRWSLALLALEVDTEPLSRDIDEGMRNSAELRLLHVQTVAAHDLPAEHARVEVVGGDQVVHRQHEVVELVDDPHASPPQSGIRDRCMMAPESAAL